MGAETVPVLNCIDPPDGGGVSISDAAIDFANEPALTLLRRPAGRFQRSDRVPRHQLASNDQALNLVGAFADAQ